MPRCLHGLLLLLLSLAPFAASAADGILIPAPNAVDMVHDAKRGLVYISTSDGKILRYKISTASFLAPFVLGPTANLAGMDLLTGNNRLAVADRDSSATELWLFEVNPDTGKATKFKARKDFYEGGMFTVAYAYNGNIYATSSFEGSGWVPLRRFTGRMRFPAIIDNVRQDTMLSASADRKTIAFAETNISDGRWGMVDVPTGQIVRREGYEDGTSWFNYEIATDALGATFVLPTYGGAYVYNDIYQHIQTIGVYAEGQPVGVAFHPTQFRVYFPWAGTSEIRVYDTTDWQQIGTYDAGYAFDHPGNASFQPGRTRVSANGQYLMVRVIDGVRLIDLSGGMAASGASRPARVR
jgi:uncharacterized protein YaiE (UPF0345 family)